MFSLSTSDALRYLDAVQSRSAASVNGRSVAGRKESLFYLSFIFAFRAPKSGNKKKTSCVDANVLAARSFHCLRKVNLRDFFFHLSRFSAASLRFSRECCMPRRYWTHFLTVIFVFYRPFITFVVSHIELWHFSRFYFPFFQLSYFVPVLLVCVKLVIFRVYVVVSFIVTIRRFFNSCEVPVLLLNLIWPVEKFIVQPSNTRKHLVWNSPSGKTLLLLVVNRFEWFAST